MHLYSHWGKYSWKCSFEITFRTSMQSYSRSLLIALCGILLWPIPNSVTYLDYLFIWVRRLDTSWTFQIQPPRRDISPTSDTIHEKQTVPLKTRPEENMEKYLNKGSTIYFMLLKILFIICWSYSLDGKANSDWTGRIGIKTFSNLWLPP